jgi:hypothetical protein
MTNQEAYQALNTTNRAMVDQVIKALNFAQANTNRASSCTKDERTEEKKEEKK